MISLLAVVTCSCFCPNRNGRTVLLVLTVCHSPLQAQHFSSVGRAAAAKVLLDLAPSSRKKNKDGNGKDSASAAATAADATDGLQDKDQQEEAGKGPKEDASANGGTGSNGAGKQEEEESEGNDDEGNPANFIMYRPLARQQQGQGQGGATAERGAIATGRLNLTTVGQGTTGQRGCGQAWIEAS